MYASIQFYNLAIASVTAGNVCPAAIYGVSTIYNPTNNAVRIKYLAQNQNKFNAYIRFRCYDNIQPPMCLHNIETPPQPHPQFLAKHSANFLIFNHPPHRLRGIFDETFLREDIVVPFVTTYAIPLRSAYIDLYIINHYCISSTKLQHLLKPAVITARTHFYKKTPWRRIVPELFCHTTFFAKMDE